MPGELILSYKFSAWRRYVVKRFFPSLSGNVNSYNEVLKLAEKYKGKIKLLVWGVTLEEEGVKLSHPLVEVIRLEDGFIRSAGLGIQLTPPISLVADPVGIYYDATKPSALETILNTHDFDPELKRRARALIHLLTEKNVTKYNLKERSWKPPRTDREIIVVPGQVETDMSVKYGSPVVKKNIELLKLVREENPHAYIVYKPHPDVVKGFRKGYYDEKLLLEFCDEVCTECSSPELILHADEVHTMTSLFGFEALMRGKRVVCWGIPFYAGWGLTRDKLTCERRKRRLSLEELVAGALILYPMYVSLLKKKPITVEEAVEELILLREKPPLRFKFWKLFQMLISPILKLRRF